ncbi:MAG TPA: sigma-70 family RNA polymerase sigma factor [Nitrolancea sp.]|nr:sigma-70 family RNA polymerase sigma factor [Nitrolancea sp.]
MKTENAQDVGPLDDAALVAAAQRDRAAFGALYERYVDPIYRYVYQRVGNHVDAEDVTAQTFQHALATLAAYEPDGLSFAAWLTATARDVIARRQRSAEHEDWNDECADGLPESTDGDLLRALRQLPLDQQRAIVLRFARKRSNREIGTALNVSEDAVKQLIYRALIDLQASLESE